MLSNAESRVDVVESMSALIISLHPAHGAERNNTRHAPAATFNRFWFMLNRRASHDRRLYAPSF